MDTEKLELIKKFLEGRDEQNYITGIEGDYFSNEVTLMIEHPEKGKYFEKHHFTPFIFIKNFKKLGKKLYSSKEEQKEAMKKHGITITELRTDSHERLEYGYKYLVTTSKKISNINQFFSKAGYNIYNDTENIFISNSGIEQFLMSTGKRLFKGFEQYKDIHKFYFDIETTSLEAADGNIFLIGMKDNRGFEKVLTIDLNNPVESERQMIIDFFNIIIYLKPAVIAGYNSEAFDFKYILGRANILGIDLGTKDEDGNYSYDVQTSLHPEKPLRRQKTVIKFGGETEDYEKTIMWGMNIIDISHSVRKAKAINSEIKAWNLKYISKYAEVAKPNRMYVKGDKIYKIWEENKWYFVNKSNNEYKLIPPANQNEPTEYKNKLIGWVLKGKEQNSLESVKKVNEFFNDDINNVDIICGKDIIFRYLLDDLYETEMIDETFNQSSFMIAGILPTSFTKSSTMGNASAWRLLLSTYSLENNLAIPITVKKRDIVGGLSRLFTTGYSKNVVKFDYKGLYPSIQLTDDVFPSLDITNVMKSMLHYFKYSRMELQALSKKHKDAGNKELANLYKIKQLPIKILANSFFGGLSSPKIFNWGDSNIGEQITCTGRQYLRLMIKFFKDRGFIPQVADTDGINMSCPDGYENFIYTDKNGNIAKGTEGYVKEFNETYMTGYMELEEDEDGILPATINFSRKNYANLSSTGKIKLTGNSLKSSTMEAYAENFFKKGIKLLLHNNGKEFIEEYYTEIKRIYNMQVPLIEIANKSKVKCTLQEYEYNKLNKKNKNGKDMSKQCHMELLLESNINLTMGEVVYYVNNGKRKSHGDIGNSYLIFEKDFESDPSRLGEYNVPRYIKKFNDRIKMLLVCFGQEVRDSLLVENPDNRQYYTDEQMLLVNGQPLDESDEDKFYSYEYKLGIDTNVPLFEMESREVSFWNRTGLDPTRVFNEFTTEFSELKLLTQQGQKTKNQEYENILNFFKSKNITIKSEMDLLFANDQVVLYKMNLLQKVDSKYEVTEKFDEYKWVISRYDDSDKDSIQFDDIEVIPPEIYEIPNSINNTQEAIV